MNVDLKQKPFLSARTTQTTPRQTTCSLRSLYIAIKKQKHGGNDLETFVTE